MRPGLASWGALRAPRQRRRRRRRRRRGGGGARGAGPAGWGPARRGARRASACGWRGARRRQGPRRAPQRGPRRRCAAPAPRGAPAGRQPTPARASRAARAPTRRAARAAAPPPHLRCGVRGTVPIPWTRAAGRGCCGRAGVSGARLRDAVMLGFHGRFGMSRWQESWSGFGGRRGARPAFQARAGFAAGAARRRPRAGPRPSPAPLPRPPPLGPAPAAPGPCSVATESTLLWRGVGGPRCVWGALALGVGGHYSGCKGGRVGGRQTRFTKRHEQAGGLSGPRLREVWFSRRDPRLHTKLGCGAAAGAGAGGRGREWESWLAAWSLQAPAAPAPPRTWPMLARSRFHALPRGSTLRAAWRRGGRGRGGRPRRRA
jgi:hypothetical protein